MLMVDAKRPPRSELIRIGDVEATYGISYSKLAYYLRTGVVESWPEPPAGYRRLVRREDMRILAEELGITPPAQPEPRDDGD